MRVGRWWRRRRARLLQLWAVGLVAACAVTGASAMGYLESLQARALDLLIYLQSPRQPSGLVIVAIDDAAFDALGRRQPLPRDYLARVLRGVTRAGAAAVGLDVSLRAATAPEADLELARAVDEIFTEVLLAPDFAPDALEWLRRKKQRRLLRVHTERIDRTQPEWRRVFGGVLVQEPDIASEDVSALPPVTARKPSEEELRALRFAWKVVKHVKSNAVVFARAGRTLALGGGATSRVDAIHAACAKAARVGIPLQGSALASDAFFPFPDGLEAAVAAGARAIVQPGGSLRDAEVIAAADRLEVSMLFTGVRHFRH